MPVGTSPRRMDSKPQPTGASGSPRRRARRWCRTNCKTKGARRRIQTGRDSPGLPSAQQSARLSVLGKAKARRHPDRLRPWALQIERLLGHNKAAIALANKLARIVWAVWKHDVDFREVSAA